MARAPGPPLRFLLIPALILAGWSLSVGDEPSELSKEAVAQETAGREALVPLQYLVGGWRGVGQVSRGSTKGSWTEKADWAWQFGKSGSALVAKVEDGKYFRELKLVPGKDGAFDLKGTTAEGKEVQFTGQRDEEEKLVLAATDAVDDLPQRVTIRSVANGDRLLVLYERKTPSKAWQRLGEVGSTRIGSGFGQGTTMRECVVTGGLGTIAVTYEGKTYYVCCTGCKELFDENPAEVLAEYRARKEAEAKKRAEQGK